ncbi:MAG: adenosylcobinamide-GDP ribazoletransferase [Firmicutes bacterium]|nr:adenosylcobinamide-GDP ribazoletransferase [Bacillota bacterium]
MVALTGLFDALAILTRIPVPQSGETRPQKSWALAWFPVVGALFGALWMIWLQDVPTLSVTLRAIGALATEVLLTGGLHWDGWADVFDGWAAPAQKRDEARRDSHIGTVGVLWLILGVVGFVGLWKGVAFVYGDAVIVFMAPVIARTAIAAGLAFMPVSDSSRLAGWFKETANPRSAFIAVVITAVIAEALWGWRGLAGLALIAGLVGMFMGYWSHFFRGVNGDVLGATVIFTELASMTIGLWLWR